ncbi:MAG: hypothetical protein E5299_01361 [Burkholderia gladioli]|nr:MAG: hypothetical protein E5299_01361 [Burkholderia gladioli]
MREGIRPDPAEHSPQGVAGSVPDRVFGHRNGVGGENFKTPGEMKFLAPRSEELTPKKSNAKVNESPPVSRRLFCLSQADFVILQLKNCPIM